jgi:hypothetical protein
LKEGDAVITGVAISGSKAGAAPAANPFSGANQRRGF